MVIRIDGVILICFQPGQFTEISRAEHSPGSAGDHKSFIHQLASILLIEFLKHIHGKSSAPAATPTGIDDQQYGFFFFLFFLPVFQDLQHVGFIRRHFFR